MAAQQAEQGVYALTSDVMYEMIVKLEGAAAYREWQAHRTVAQAARQWWIDYCASAQHQRQRGQG